MRLCTFYQGEATNAGIIVGDKLIRLDVTDILEVIEKYKIADLQQVTPEPDSQLVGVEDIKFAAPYMRPSKIWGIGLNYREHAKDLDETSPQEEPASFMKPATAIVGPGDPIILPAQSSRVTGEAELGVIIGQRCKDVPISKVPDVIFGYTTIIDMTAEDILRRNPRFLTRAKSFDTFFSFGPVVVTSDEIPDVSAITVATILNGRVGAQNVVSNMTFSPYELVSFHSNVMTLEAGDIISTGTPGALQIRRGDRIECYVEGIGSLVNPVV